MSEQVNQESQKTVVSFIAGLLIGGLLVWVFGGTPKEAVAPNGANSSTSAVTNASTSATQTTSASTTSVKPATGATSVTTGTSGAVKVNNQPAGSIVTLSGATFPVTEGWIAVRTYQNGQLGSVLGAARFSKSLNLIPNQIELLAPTIATDEYAIVFYSEDGTKVFNLAGDKQVGDIAGTFTAQ